MSGWQEYTVFDAEKDTSAEKLPAEVDFEDAHYICGITALTAYFGLLKVCEMKPGDVVFVSGAGGATGSMVGQLAKALGAGKVVGIAGGADKCKYLKETLGYDEAIDYKVDRKTFTRAVSEVLKGTKGIDCYFDNTGGHRRQRLEKREIGQYAMRDGLKAGKCSRLDGFLTYFLFALCSSFRRNDHRSTLQPSRFQSSRCSLRLNLFIRRNARPAHLDRFRQLDPFAWEGGGVFGFGLHERV